MLTIAGERLELSRMLRLSWQQYLGFLLALSIVLAGLLALAVGCIMDACDRRGDGRSGVVVAAL